MGGYHNGAHEPWSNARRAPGNGGIIGPMTSRADPRPRSLIALAILVATLISIAVIGALYVRLYEGRVLHGVTAAGVPLGGLDAVSAAERLAQQLPVTRGEVVLRDPNDGRTWRMTPAELGLALDADTLARAALRVGRDGNVIRRAVAPFSLLLRGRDLLEEPPFDADRARTSLLAIAPEVDVAPKDAGLTLSNGAVQVRPPVYGRQLDVDATLALLPGLAASPEVDTLDLALIITAPRVFDVGSVAEAYERITSGPLNIGYQGRTFTTVDVDTLTNWTTITSTTTAEGDAVPAIALDETAIRQLVESLADEIDRLPANARFRFTPSGEVEVVESSHPGLTLNVAGSVEGVIRGAYTEQRVAELAVDTLAPDVRDDMAQPISGRARMLAQAYTGIGGAPVGRMSNMLVASGMLDGVTVAPGATFSLIRQLGPVTAEAGFDMAQIDAGTSGGSDYIGGLDQVATTAFRAAVWAGLPIDMRTAPANRSPWVEPPIGLDAAIGPSGRDLQFTNDTGDVLFFSVTLDTARDALEWTIYGVSQMRRVELVGPKVTDLTPAPSGAADRRTDLLPQGTRTQVLWSRSGADVVVERVVSVAGAESSRDTFASRYEPVGDVVLVGTGTRPDGG